MAQYLDFEGLKTLWTAIGIADDATLNSAKESFKTTLESNLSFQRIQTGETGHELQLVLTEGENTKVIASFNDSEYVKDGILQNVAIIDISDTAKYPDGIWYDQQKVTTGKFIEFTWNTDAGIATDYLKVDEIGKIYKEDNEISANSSITIGTDNTLSVNKVTADKTKTTSAITIAGGPLANQLKGLYGNSIPAGTSLQDLLQALACEELLPNPEAKATYGTFTISLDAPAITAPSWNNTLVEVGEPIVLPGATGKNTYTSTPALSFDNFAYGYSITEGDNFTASATETNPPTVLATIKQITEDVVYTLTRTVSNFILPDGTSNTATAANGADITFNTVTATTKIGENKIKYTLNINKINYSAKVNAENVYYALTNLGKTTLVNKNGVTSQQKVDKTAMHTYSVSKPNDSTTSVYKVTAVYPVYTNISNGAFIETTTTRLALSSGNEFVIDAPTEVNSPYVFTFEYPACKTISSFKTTDLQGAFVDLDPTAYTISDMEYDRTIHNVVHKYKRLYTHGGTGETKYKITFSSNLNV